MIFCRLSEPYSSSSKKIFNVKKIKFLNYPKNKSGQIKGKGEGQGFKNSDKIFFKMLQIIKLKINKCLSLQQ